MAPKDGLEQFIFYSGCTVMSLCLCIIAYGVGLVVGDWLSRKRWW